MTQAGKIHIGVGGWIFEPWRGVFYPDDLKQKDELAYMSARLSAIEINSTYYGSQKPGTWANWTSQVPDGFVFAVKGSRFCTNRRVLKEGAESIDRFMNQGLSELGDKLGPILWQFAPTKKFDADDFTDFLDLLPEKLEGRRLRHCVEVRNDSFCTPEFPALLRKHGVTCVYADHGTYPEIADVTGPLVYARLQTGSDDIPTAYAPAALDQWAGRLKTWASGGEPADLPKVDPQQTADKMPREVFAFIIHEGKVRAPHGAMALIERTL